MNHLQKVAEACQYLLANSPEGEVVRSYLDARISRESQEKYCFGYFPSVEYFGLLTSLVGENALREMGLLWSEDIEDSVSSRTIYHPWFENQPLIMPYRNVYGNIVGIVGRSLLDESKRPKRVEKYKNTDFKKGQHLFGLYECKAGIIEKDFVYVVEGQFDVIKATEKGINNIVALGSAGMTDYQVSILARYTKNIILLLDNDAAGERGRSSAENKFGNVVNINNMYLPEGYKDMDDYLKDNDGDTLTFAAKNSKIHY